jgi:hypothetical protein
MNMKKKVNSEKPIFRSSLVMTDGRIVEMVYDEESSTSQFVVLDGDEIKTLPSFTLDPREPDYIPYPASHSMIKNKVILFPSEATEYGNEKALILEISSFIHKYLDVSKFFEDVASYYVLFSWVYDNFNELPYLRAIGDYGSGKTRLLQTIGSICYKPTFAGGATSVSPIFRLCDEFRGTLIMDEADFSQSDTYAEIIKILNSGHGKGIPVIRSESNSRNQFDARAFSVFCPKILATRNYFKDKALESRFIVEEMGQLKLRNDIPINLPDEFWAEALEIRNKLLMFRLKNYGKRKINIDLLDRSLEPRLNQIIMPLMSVIDDVSLQQELRASVKDYSLQMSADRGMEFDGQILDAIFKLTSGGNPEPTVGQIKDQMEQDWEDETGKNLTARGIGSRLRQSFKLKTRKTRSGFVIPESERPKLERWFQRYGIDGNVNDVNVVNNASSQTIKEAKTVEDISAEEVQKYFDSEDTA